MKIYVLIILIIAFMNSLTTVSSFSDITGYTIALTFAIVYVCKKMLED